MKMIVFSLIAMMSVFPLRAVGQTSKPSGKTLVVYFSRSGNTQAVAEHIRALTGADVFRVEPVKSYPEDYRQCTDVAKEELEKQARPAIKGKVEDIGQYDTVFIGYPIWWGTYPMPVATFLENYDLKGKTVIPFCTHEGSREGRSFSDIRKVAPQAKVAEGLAIRGGQASSSQKDIQAWLRKIGVIEE